MIDADYAKYEKFVRGEMSLDEANVLRCNTPRHEWYALLQVKADREMAMERVARAVEKSKLISECLAPLEFDEGDLELGMRQIRLLAAILERLP